MLSSHPPLMPLINLILVPLPPRQLLLADGPHLPSVPHYTPQRQGPPHLQRASSSCSPEAGAGRARRRRLRRTMGVPARMRQRRGHPSRDRGPRHRVGALGGEDHRAPRERTERRSVSVGGGGGGGGGSGVAVCASAPPRPDASTLSSVRRRRRRGRWGGKMTEQTAKWGNDGVVVSVDRPTLEDVNEGKDDFGVDNVGEVWQMEGEVEE
ncbi:hypothetical protein Taro_005978 [Colocasia esculenta]|uniref:Uncharacterized protein n=1 Tax=Colocasia esculenta TaxID=4460 RepID=A0A843TRD3_COLES|nr:hypothetical protein [Colocasia esculenta]